MAKLVEMDEKISIREQLEEDVGHIILINKFNVEPNNSEFAIGAMMPLTEKSMLILTNYS
jgi:hypothetical protein